MDFGNASVVPPLNSLVRQLLRQRISTQRPRERDEVARRLLRVIPPVVLVVATVAPALWNPQPSFDSLPPPVLVPIGGARPWSFSDPFSIELDGRSVRLYKRMEISEVFSELGLPNLTLRDPHQPFLDEPREAAVPSKSLTMNKSNSYRRRHAHPSDTRPPLRVADTTV